MKAGTVYLALAILAEVVGTTALKFSEGMTRPLYGALVVVSYMAAFYLLGLALRSFPLGTAYAIWAGVGVVLVAIAGAIFFRESFTVQKVVGMALVIAGVALLELQFGSDDGV